jgi:pilus assembly protein CpaF
MSSLHSNSASDAITRLGQMILRNGLTLSPNTIGKMVATAIDIVIFQEKLVDGSRHVTEIVEILGYENDEPKCNHLYKFEITDVDDNGKIIGEHRASENCYFSPQLIKKLLSKGVKREQLKKWDKGGVVDVY